MCTNSTHLVGLAEFVPLAVVPKLKICHQVALEHPLVIVGNQTSKKEDHLDTRLNLDTTGVNQKDLSSTKKTPPALQSFMLLPPQLTTEIKKLQVMLVR